jgi:hypothetical protein
MNIVLRVVYTTVYRYTYFSSGLKRKPYSFYSRINARLLAEIPYSFTSVAGRIEKGFLGCFYTKSNVGFLLVGGG